MIVDLASAVNLRQYFRIKQLSKMFFRVIPEEGIPLNILQPLIFPSIELEVNNCAITFY